MERAHVKCYYWQVYDMQFELNEIEARREQYPSTISFLNLLNALIAEEKDVSDRGRRYWFLASQCFLVILISSAFCTLLQLQVFFADLLASLGSYMIMYSGLSLNEPMQTLVRNGNWLLLVWSIFTCEYLSLYIVHLWVVVRLLNI